MLAAIGVLVVSASAAQAKWLILVGTNSVLKIELSGTGSLGAILIPGLFQIECHKGTSQAALTLSGDHKTLTGSGNASFTECLVKDSTGKVNANCSVDSPGGAANTITASFAGAGEMEGSKIYSTLKSGNFSEVELNGALCPLNEFDARSTER